MVLFSWTDGKSKKSKMKTYVFKYTSMSNDEGPLPTYCCGVRATAIPQQRS